MTPRSVLVFSPGVGVASTLSGLTAKELVQYVLGYYESLHHGIEVQYPEGKEAFVVQVLCEGYGECVKVTEWSHIPEVIEIDLEELEPTPGPKLDHASFHDVHAYKLIVKQFAANL